MLIPHGCCSALLLLHLSSAQNRCQSSCPCLPSSSIPMGAPVWLYQAGAPGAGRVKAGNALSSGPIVAASCCSALASFPKNGKKPSLPKGCPPPLDALPDPEGIKQKHPKKPQITGNSGRAGPALATTQLCHLHGTPQLRGRAGVGTIPVPCKANRAPPHQRWGTPKPCWGACPARQKGMQGLGCTHRRGEGSFPLGPNPEEPLV